MLKGICFTGVVLILAFIVVELLVSAHEKKEAEISEELKSKIKRLIDQLGADDWQKREAATKALEEIGAPAEPFLKKALQSKDLEVVTRAKRLLFYIDLTKQGKILFSRTENEKRGIYIMDGDGKNQIRLTSEDSEEHYPKWSPDGKMIAFQVGPFDGDLCVMDIDGRNRTKLTKDIKVWMASFSWSPDGKKIAFASKEEEEVWTSGGVRKMGGKGTGGIYVIDIDGRNQRRLVKKEGLPLWSPNGEKIAFVSGEIYLMDPDGKNQICLTKDKGGDFNPCWSPDSKKITFVSERNGNWEIYTMDADGKNQTRLTFEEAYDNSPEWSPDGKKIVFVSRRDGGDESKDEIYIMDADGKNQIRLSNNNVTDGSTYWSSNGKYIVFHSCTEEGSEIWVMDMTGENQTKLTQNGGWGPTWQPVPKNDK